MLTISQSDGWAPFEYDNGNGNDNDNKNYDDDAHTIEEFLMTSH